MTYIVEATNDLTAAWITLATLPPGTPDWTLTAGAARNETGSGATRVTTITDVQLITGQTPRFLRLRIVP